MKKRIIALSIIFSMMVVLVVPTTSQAARPWVRKLIDVVLEDVRGGLDGYDNTGTLSGAVKEGAKRSIDAGMLSGQGGGKPYRPSPFAEESIGLHHNLALNAVIGDGKLSQLKDDEINKRLMEYLEENKLLVKDKEEKRKITSDELKKRLNEILTIIVKETEDPIREGEDPVDVMLKAVDYLKDGIREEAREVLEEIPFRKLEEIVRKENERQLKEGEELVYIIEGKKVLPDDIGYLVAASILEHSFEFWGGYDIDMDDDYEPLKLGKGWFRRLVGIVKADVSGAIDGYNATDSIGGAIVFGGLNSAFNGIDAGAGQGNWENAGPETIGSLHNKALTVVYGAEDMPQAMLYFIEKENIQLGDKGKKAMLECLPPDGCTNDSDWPWPLGTKKTNKIKNVSEEFNSNLENVTKLAFEEENFNGDKLIEELKVFLDRAAKASGTKPMILKANEYEKIRSSLDMENKPYDILYASMFIDMYTHSIGYWLGEDIGDLAIGEPVDDELERLLEIIDFLDNMIQDPGEGSDDGIIDEKDVAITLTIDSYNARINGEIEKMDVIPVVRNQRVLVPFRFIGEALDADIDWIQESQEATYELGDMKISLFIGKKGILVNGKEMEMDVEPLVINQRILVPVRMVSETLGFEVEWHQKEQEVRIFNK